MEIFDGDRGTENIKLDIKYDSNELFLDEKVLLMFVPGVYSGLSGSVFQEAFKGNLNSFFHVEFYFR